MKRFAGLSLVPASQFVARVSLLFASHRRRSRKKEIMHSLAPVLTLILSLTHSHDYLANKLLRTTSTSYGVLTNVGRDEL